MSTGPINELRYALAEGEAELTPAGLTADVLAAAVRVRVPGRAVNAPVAISSVAAFGRAVAHCDDLLSQLTADEWDTASLRGLTVQCLVGHLVGVERHFHGSIGLEPDEHWPDHIADTAPATTAEAGAMPADTVARWRAAVARTLDALGTFDDDALAAMASLHGVTLPLNDLLLARVFELWTHEEDIRRAVGRPLLGVDHSVLARMTHLAVPLLPVGVLAGDALLAPGSTATVVLTGPAGGVWTVHVGGQATLHDAPTVRIVADALDFCRLVANRCDPAEIDAELLGDQTLGALVLAAAPRLALD